MKLFSDELSLVQLLFVIIATTIIVASSIVKIESIMLDNKLKRIEIEQRLLEV